MPSFSQRNNYVAAPIVQHEAIDDRLKNALWSVIDETIDSIAAHSVRQYRSYEQSTNRIREVWVEFYGGARDQIAPGNASKAMRDNFYQLKWHRTFDLLEYLVAKWGNGYSLREKFNVALEREHSAYRISDSGSVMEVTDKNQLAAINDAMAKTSAVDDVHKHLAEAQKCYAQRDDGGYRNCMKESICAVETLAKLIVKQPHATLGAVLPDVGKFIKIHPHQVEAWRDVWRYTSDRPGVRHGAPEADTGPVTSEEALHMLVTCSSFVTYLLERAADAKIALA